MKVKTSIGLIIQPPAVDGKGERPFQAPCFSPPRETELRDRADGPIGAVQTPCVRNCCLDDNEICLGCHRSIAEIVGWNEADDSERKEILAKCRLRYQRRYGSDPGDKA